MAVFLADLRRQGLAWPGGEAEDQVCSGKRRLGEKSLVLAAHCPRHPGAAGVRGVGWVTLPLDMAVPTRWLCVSACSHKAEQLQSAAPLLLTQPWLPRGGKFCLQQGQPAASHVCLGSWRCSIFWLPLHFTHLRAGEVVTCSLVLAGLQNSLRQSLDFP